MEYGTSFVYTNTSYALLPSFLTVAEYLPYDERLSVALTCKFAWNAFANGSLKMHVSMNDFKWLYPCRGALIEYIMKGETVHRQYKNHIWKIYLKLPLSTQHIDLSDCVNLTEIYASYNKLTSFIVPNGCKIVYCDRNRLLSLDIPDGCEEVNCVGNRLLSLTIPIGCKRLYCSANKFTTLDIPDGCEEVVCVKNRLSSLDIPASCTYVNCKYNPLRHIRAPKSCEVICDDQSVIEWYL